MPLSRVILLQAIAGFGVAVLLGAVGLWLARPPDAPAVGDESQLSRDLLASGAAYSIGVGLGVHWAGRLLGRPGRALGTLIGTLSGMALTLVIVFGARRFRLPPAFLTSLLLGGGLLGAIAGFHLSAWRAWRAARASRTEGER